MKYLFIIIFFTVLIRAAYSNVMLFITIVWYKRNNRLYQNYPKKDMERDFVVIIPILREQKNIEETVNYFLNMKYNLEKIFIILVTTEKENLDAEINNFNGESTIEVAKRIGEEVNKTYNRDLLTHLHYPDPKGKMVHQLNYAFEHVRENFSQLDNTFVAIYNADSRPNPDTFGIIDILSTIKNYKVFQQSSLFFKNLNQIKVNGNLWAKIYLFTNAVLQSRWTLAHEVPRFIRQSFLINKYNYRFFLAHCVGHGLFIRCDLFKEIKYMPTITVTEDLFFGYILSLLKISINPVYVLENSDSPSTFSSVMKQKYVWFFGPLDHLNYEKYFIKNYTYTDSKFILHWMTFQGLIPAIAWFSMGWFILFILAYPIFISDYKLFSFSLMLFIFYGPFSYSIVLFFAKENKLVKSLNYTDYIMVAFFSLPTIMLHSIPPVYSLYSKIRSKYTKIDPIKPKTE